jgi:xylulokinase
VNDDAVLLGIDAGTSGTKLTLIDLAGGILGEVTEQAGYTAPRPGWSEAEPEVWWANTCAGIPRLLASTGCTAERVAGVGVCGTVPVVVLADGQGRVLRPAIQQNDARATEEIEYFKARTNADDVLRRTGSPITQQSIGPKLLWLRRHEPDLLAETRHLCGSYEFIVERLTGAWIAERNWALESGLYDFGTRTWDAPMLELATIAHGWLPGVRAPADVVGEVQRAAAAATGLRVGTPVVAGSADHVASAFSAGVVEPGDLLVKLGGTGDVLLCTEQPIVDPRLFLDYHVMDDRYLPNGCMAASGNLIVWFQRMLAPTVSYAELDAEADATPAGADGMVLLPYFLGEKTPLFDPFARGTILGLTLSHTRGHLFRALLEGIGFGFRHHLEVLSELAPLPNTARCTNGGARSRLWKQITSDVLGLPLEGIAQHPGSSLGAAFVAGMGIAAFRDWRDIHRYVRVDEVTEPSASAHARYDELYPVYRETYERLRDLYPRLRANQAP